MAIDSRKLQAASRIRRGGRVLRFNIGERLAHWAQAIPFLLLLATGSALLFRGWGGLLGPEGVRAARGIHRVMAYPFTLLPFLILATLTPRSARGWLKDIVHWKRSDIDFLRKFPLEFFGGKVDLPEQGRFNAGEKINSLLTIFGTILMIGTGWVLVLQDRFAADLVQWVHLLHSAGALVMGTVILGHMYLGLGHPGSRASIWGMLNGTVSKEFAQEHHALWYRQQVTSEEEDRDQAV